MFDGVDAPAGCPGHEQFDDRCFGEGSAAENEIMAGMSGQDRSPDGGSAKPESPRLGDETLIGKPPNILYLDRFCRKQVRKIVSFHGNDLDWNSQGPGGVGYVGRVDMEATGITAAADEQEVPFLHRGDSSTASPALRRPQFIDRACGFVKSCRSR